VWFSRHTGRDTGNDGILRFGNTNLGLTKPKDPLATPIGAGGIGSTVDGIAVPFKNYYLPPRSDHNLDSSRIPGGLVNRTGAAIGGVQSAPTGSPTDTGVDPWGNRVPDIPNPGTQPVNIPASWTALPKQGWMDRLATAIKGIQAAPRASAGDLPLMPVMPLQVAPPQVQHIDPAAVLALLQAQQQRLQTRPTPRPPVIQGLLTR
jgi:hypothetical protein